MTLPFAVIAAGVVFALMILFWGARLASRRRAANEEIEEFNEDYVQETPPARPITPPVAPPPPPIVEPPVAAPEPIAPPPAPAPEPVAEAHAPVAAPEPVVEPEPVAEIVPAPLPPVVEETPAPEPLAPEPLADEPIAAAFDASPAALASDVAAPVPAEPAPAPAPAPAATAADDLTRMKGVGPRLADRLGTVGITSFAQLAALTPEEADALDAKLGDFQGRIHRDRWIEQASFLAKDDIAGFEGVFGKL
ncbi:hypothetical protein HZY97_17570 [Sphingomonas sp. R-74633]|uniref:hypothetical protein n=1 Tax=Sphingomonas sp. R-74633 TaxID=2751188 RepID=UPI0015D11AAB|nr:hypothetical protein [Sphingomonas sp. R-74633]NYT42586.1 hypothetical protein [Sphingomonas sp. R-74633]